MIQSIHTWFSSLNWNMWAGIGQMIGALATVGTAWIALRQVNQANKQMEEARKREEEAQRPDLNVIVSINDRDKHNRILLDIFLTNTKQIPVYVYDVTLMNVAILEGDKIVKSKFSESNFIPNTQIPGLIPYRDVCITQIGLYGMFESLRKSNKTKGLFIYNFIFTVDIPCIISIFIEYVQKEDFGHGWKVYVSKKEVTAIEEIKKEEYFLAAYALKRKPDAIGNSAEYSIASVKRNAL